MVQRCFLGNIRTLLDGVQGTYFRCSKDHVLLSSLSKVQKELQSNIIYVDGVFIYKEAEDCTLLEVISTPCTKDTIGLSVDLVRFLAFENPFVNHSAGKVLSALVDYVEQVSALWLTVINVLWDSLKTSLGVSKDGSGRLLLSVSQGNEHVKQLRNWTFVKCIFQVLNHIFRKTKHEQGSKLKVLISCFGRSIIETLGAFTAYSQPEYRNMVNHEDPEYNLALGMLLRFLCTVCHAMDIQSDIINTKDIVGGSSVFESINVFMTTFSDYCLNKNHSLTHYLRHKFLMLLFRLNPWFEEMPYLALSCSNTLRSHSDCLCGSLLHNQGQSTMRSPFAPSLLSYQTNTFAPERNAIFLIFKLTVALENSCSGDTTCDKKCASSVKKLYVVEWEQWMLNWLLSKAVSVEDLSRVGVTEAANHMASSFLQIVIDEDTLLLEMLLLLLEFSKLQVLEKHFSACSGAVDLHCNSLDLRSQILISAFKPLCLFRVFLSLVCYDHLVILDFLISKDTSVLCLKYLIRCLRIIISTWPEFISLGSASFDLYKGEGVKIQLQTDNETNQHSTDCTAIHIEKVAECLLNLRNSIERAHRKNTFPYNPSPLLKLISSFEKLWVMWNSSHNC